MTTPTPQTVQELTTLFLEWSAKNCSPGTVAGYRRHLERFARAHGDTPLTQLRPFDLTSWDTRWHPLQAVQRLFSWAHESAGIVDRNPFRTVKRPPAGRRRRILDRVEVVKLMRRARPDFRAYLLALRESIARPQEIRAVCWEELSILDPGRTIVQELRDGRGAFFLEEYKARKRRLDPSAPRIVPVSPRLGRLLARLAGRRRFLFGPVFLTGSGKSWTANAVRLRMSRLRDLVGLGPDHRGERVVCYTFRHTAATEACSLGIRDRLLAELMGHTSTRTTARYQHLQADHLLSAARELWERRKGDRLSG